MDTDFDRTKIPILQWAYELLEKLLCIMCHSLLYPPMQITCCGQRICGACSQKLSQLTQCQFCTCTDRPKIVLDKGFQRELNTLQINCPRCDQWEGSFNNLLEHLERDHHDLRCQNCQQTFIFPKQLLKHEQDDCQHRKIACPLAFLGCSREIPNHEITDHYLTGTHQNSLLRFITEILLETSGKHLKKNNEKAFKARHRSELNGTKERIDQLLTHISESLQNCSSIDHQRLDLQDKVNNIHKQLDGRKKMFANGSETLQRCQDIIKSIEDMLMDIKSKPMQLSLISSDGNYISKIDILRFNNGDQIIKSECISTSYSGYRISLTYKTHTNEKNKERYLSVELTVLKGDFDAILPWPMPFPITIYLLNLTGNTDHISRSVSNQSCLESFDKPKTNSNPPILIEKFCDLNKINQERNAFVQDNSIFIQLSMDFTAAISSTHSAAAKFSSQSSNDNIRASILHKVK